MMPGTLSAAAKRLRSAGRLRPQNRRYRRPLATPLPEKAAAIMGCLPSSMGGHGAIRLLESARWTTGRESAEGVSPELSRLGGVPRLATFYGVAVYMYARDHGVAHFHARHGDDEAVIEVATGTVLQGSLPPARAKLVDQWTELHRAELLEAWSRASNGEPPGTIEPLP